MGMPIAARDSRMIRESSQLQALLASGHKSAARVEVHDAKHAAQFGRAGRMSRKGGVGHVDHNEERGDGTRLSEHNVSAERLKINNDGIDRTTSSPAHEQMRAMQKAAEHQNDEAFGQQQAVKRKVGDPPQGGVAKRPRSVARATAPAPAAAPSAPIRLGVPPVPFLGVRSQPIPHDRFEVGGQDRLATQPLPRGTAPVSAPLAKPMAALGGLIPSPVRKAFSSTPPAPGEPAAKVSPVVVGLAYVTSALTGHTPGIIRPQLQSHERVLRTPAGENLEAVTASRVAQRAKNGGAGSVERWFTQVRTNPNNFTPFNHAIDASTTRRVTVTAAHLSDALKHTMTNPGPHKQAQLNQALRGRQVQVTTREPQLVATAA